MHLTLVPAYGRTYTSRKAILADLIRDDRDFKATGFHGSGYITGPELFEQGGHTEVNVRYPSAGRPTKVTVITRAQWDLAKAAAEVTP
jgi:hypothetical protein